MSEAESDERLPGHGTDDGALLQKAHDAFVRGDYREVRVLTAKLDKAPEEVANAAAELRRKVSVDPAQLAVFALCLLFFFFIVWKYVP